MSFDLESLRLIWWLVLGTAITGLAVCEGLTLGVTLLLPILARTTAKRRTLLDSIAPISLGNLAWLATAIAILFAAWPIAYAVSFASLYPALLMLLLTLLPRSLALYFIDDIENPQWREYGYTALAIGGLLPAALLGLLAGNLLKGIPFHLDSDMRIVFLGDFMTLLNPFALLVAATALALLSLHGAAYLQLKTGGELQQQAQAMLMRAGVAFIILFALAGLWITHLEGYHISSELFPNAASNPLAKFVKRGEGLWLDNYEHLPALSALPVMAFLGAFAALLLTKWHRAYWAMIASAVSVAMTVLTFGVSMFPFLLPSNISLNSSLTLWDSSASQPALQTLLWVTVVALPLIVAYTRWLYQLFAGKIGLDISADNGDTAC